MLHTSSSVINKPLIGQLSVAIWSNLIDLLLLSLGTREKEDLGGHVGSKKTLKS
jgi:hypothetical protein